MGSRTGYIGNPERHTYEDLWRYRFNSYSCLGATKGCIYAQPDSVWPNSGGTIALGPDEYPTGISINGTFYNYDDTDQSIELFICDSSGGNAYSLGKHSFSPAESYGAGNFNKSGQSWTNLRGKTIALKKGYGGTGYADFGVGWWEQATVVITTALVYTACGAPSNVRLSSAISEGNVTLSWNAGSAGSSNSIQRYRIQYRESSNGSSWGAWADYTTTTATSVAVAPSGTRGYYRQFQVRTEGSAGASYYSGYVASGTLRRDIAPTNPSGLSASPAVFEGAITLSWNASSSSTSSISQYNLSYRTYNGSSWSAWSSEWSNGTNRTYTASPSLTRGYQIQYRVRAVDAFGVASGYVEFSSLQKNMVPGAPSGISASPAVWENGKITVSWTAAAKTTSNISYYEVALDASNNGTRGTAVNVGNVTSYQFDAPSFSRGAKIKYYVRAIDALGVASDWVESSVVTRNSLPTVPGSFEVTPARYESGNIVLSWEASTDADGNLSDYVLQYAVSADGTTWGDWTALDVVTDPGYNHEPTLMVLPRGSFIKYRVAARDTLGAMSAYAETTTVRKNRLPETPVIQLPVASAMATLTPGFKVSYSAEPDGMAQTVSMWAVKDGQTVWSSSKSVSSAAGIAYFRAELQAAGTYEFFARVSDELAHCLADASRTITLSETEFSREIASGDIISNESISHKADITEMWQMINAKRAAYGLAEIVLDQETENGYFAKWKTIMERFAAAIRACYTVVGEEVPQVTVSSQYPSAAVINAIRNLISGA